MRIKKSFFVVIAMTTVAIYLVTQNTRGTITRVPQDVYSTDLARHANIQQTNTIKWNTWKSYHDEHSRINSFNKTCTNEYKHSHYLLIDFQPGRTGNNLFQLYCALVTALQMCYTVIIEPHDRYYKRGIMPFFDLGDDFEIIQLNNESFHSFRGSPVPLVGNKAFVCNAGYNLILDNRCRAYIYTVGYEDFIRFSIRFKANIKKMVSDYLAEFFVGRSPVAIHVRRADKVGFYGKYGYKYSSLEWYKPYIDRAMDYLLSRYTNLSFIFVTDDKKWCRENFRGENIHVSPFMSPGMDLALMTKCDHVILTMGTFGWHGAWLGRPKTVIYDSTCVYKDFLKGDFFLPEWTDIGLNNTECPEPSKDAFPFPNDKY